MASKLVVTNLTSNNHKFKAAKDVLAKYIENIVTCYIISYD